jgi:hypothetical protein
MAVATLLVVLVGAGIVWRISSHHDRVVLSDGTVIQYLGVTDGDKLLSISPAWQQFARKILPKNLQSRLPPERWILMGLFDTTVFLGIEGASDRPSDNRRGITLRTVADDGFRYENASVAFDYTPEIRPWMLTGYPRRQTRFTVEIADAAGNTLLSFVATNPKPASTNIWSPQPLPIRQTNGPVVLTLLGFAATNNAPGDRLSPRWTVESSDPHLSTIAAAYLGLSDASGNWGRSLDPAESAWKLRASVQRTRREQFTRQETIVLTNLPIPAANGFLPIRVDGAAAGAGTVLGFLGGAGHLAYAEVTNSIPIDTRSEGMLDRDRIGWNSGSPYLRIDVSGITNIPTQVLIDARDDQNRVVPVYATAQSISTREKRRGNWALHLQADAKSVTIEINVSAPLEFEFLVDPKELMQGGP